MADFLHLLLAALSVLLNLVMYGSVGFIGIMSVLGAVGLVREGVRALRS